jgi:hypothetical protein
MRRPNSHPYLGLALIILIPVVAISAAFFCLWLLVGFNWTGGKGSLLTGLTYGLVGAAVLVLLAVSKRLRAKGASPNRESDPRPQVLYLRSFQNDQTSLTATGTREQHLASVMTEIGPLVAIGRPGDSLAPLGAERRYCENEDWKDEVGSLIAQARFVVIQAGASTGLLWEINEVTKRLKPEQILISLRNKDRVFRPASDEFAQDQYDKFRAMTSRFLLHPLPEKLGDATFLCFEADWKAHLLSPTKWRPYNLSPTAKIRETIRPILEKQGVELSMFQTRLQGVLMSLLLLIGVVLVLGVLSIPFLP